MVADYPVDRCCARRVLRANGSLLFARQTKLERRRFPGSPRLHRMCSVSVVKKQIPVQLDVPREASPFVECSKMAIPQDSRHHRAFIGSFP
eukprot:1184356-Prorocentrum_minimum.AAC.1